MATRCRLRSEPSTMLLLYSWILLSWIPEMVSAASVTLESIQIYQTHEPLGSPTLYFLCKGENKTYLPDVKEKDKPYEFKGEEPWQPLTQLLDKNCKRCGFYEEDMGADDVFDEWEFCASAFTSADGKYTYSKEKEFNATFLCLECVHLVDEPISGAVVTLDSIQIYQTHELLGSDPDLYFQCEGENKTSLPDVKIKDNLYEFNGKESWQPLTQLLDKNCKRCGIYEEDTGPDDVFDEWQVCASEFTSGGGKCTHFKENEFKATFSCPNCPSLVGSDAAPPANSPSRNERRGITWILTLPIAILVLVFSVLGW